MSRKTRLSVGVVAIALAAVLVSAAVAIASSTVPTLGSPNHKSVNHGRPTLHVKVPLAASSVFIAIDPHKQLSNGDLVGTCGPRKGCDYVETGKHNGHTYILKAPAYSFPGWWATTPGKYYWQAEYFTAGNTAYYYSTIGSFTVKSVPVLIAGHYRGRRPTTIDISGDAGDVVTRLRWSSWKASRATGQGTSNIQGCVPDCARGTETPVPTSIKLLDPMKGYFTKLVERRDGQTEVFVYTPGHFPDNWPDGAS